MGVLQEPEEASAYYDLSQYAHYEQPAEEAAASRALLARLTRDAAADGDTGTSGSTGSGFLTQPCDTKTNAARISRTLADRMFPTLQTAVRSTFHLVIVTSWASHCFRCL